MAIPTNTQEGDGGIVEQVPPTEENEPVESNAAVEVQDSGLQESDNGGRNGEPGTTINNGSESSVHTALSLLELSGGGRQPADALMKLSERTAETVVQDGTLGEQMDFLYALFSCLDEEDREHKEMIANLTAETEMLKIKNSNLVSQIEGVKARVVALRGEERVLEEKIAFLEDDLQKKEELKSDKDALRHTIKWLEKEYSLLNQHSRLQEEKNIALQNELDAKQAEISLFLLELESDQKTESEELQALKEEGTAMQKKLESCKETARGIIDDTVKISRETAQKEEKIRSMASEHNEWMIDASIMISNLRENFVGMQATICDKVNALAGSFSNLIDKLAASTCKDSVRGGRTVGGSDR